MAIEQQIIEERARELAKQITQENAQLNSILTNGRIFTRFDYRTDVVENQKEIVTAALFSNNTTNMINFFTSSNQTSVQKQYYYDVTQEASSNEVEFSITYGHINGSGSLIGTYQTYPSKAIYRQYKQLLLDPGEDVFKFKDNSTTNHIYAINVKRERFKQRLDPGNWELTLSELNGLSFSNQNYTGSNVQVSGSGKVIKLVDDSLDSAQTVSTLTDAGRVYNIVSGSIEDGIYIASTGSYGLLYPDQGVIILNADMLNSELNFNSVTGSNIEGDNTFKLFKSISGSAVIMTTGSFEGRSSEIITSTYYYVRVKNTEYNFSTNPSFTTGSLGDLKHQIMIQNPSVYLTTIGMYNDRQELLAIGKLSKPILKTFANEINITVKIDW